jgi:hypothetical protein
VHVTWRAGDAVSKYKILDVVFVRVAVTRKLPVNLEFFPCPTPVKTAIATVPVATATQNGAPPPYEQ